MDNKKRTILIVEDELPMLRILNDRLISSGFRTILAQNGEEGLQLALQNRPDLIILDILMPRMNGTVTINKLREDVWGRTVPIIMLTNVSPDTDAALNEIVKNQPAYYFVKSDIELDILVERIKDIFNSAKQTEQ